MAAILCLFSAAFFWLFSRSLYNQVDESLKSLVLVTAPSFTQISQENKDLSNLDNVSWREIFNSEQQSLEWFDAQGRLLARQGNLKLLFPPKQGFWTLISQKDLLPYQIRTYTLPIKQKSSISEQLTLVGYIRGGQTTQEIQTVQNQFLWQLGFSVLTVLGLIALGGLWLTKKALEPVMQSFKQLQQFTADASHELRGPLTAIKASVDVMRNHPERFETKDAKKLAAIASATEQMTHLTQDLLFLARSEAKSSVLNQQDWHCLALDALLDDLFEWLEPVAEAKNIHFKYDCLAKAKIRGDQAQLSRLFSNLLENAINYTPEGGKIRLRLTQHNQTALVSIKDTGIGIPSESLPFVFDRFWRADQARTYRQGGTGLGLAIAMAIARVHGGQITVSSEMGKGSCFQVSLPLYRSETTKRIPQWSSWEILKQLQNLRTNQSWHLLKKSAQISLILILSILPVVILAVAFNQVQTFKGLQFPQGGISFADEVIYYQKNAYAVPIELTSDHETLNHPLEALGIPNAKQSKRFFFFDQPNNSVTLGPTGTLNVKFTDNLLSGNGNSQNDLWIFSSEPLKHPLMVAISQDGMVWYDVGYVDGQQGGINLDQWGWGKKDFFSYVRLTYDLSTAQQTPKNTANSVEIDAIGAITSVKIIASQRGWFPHFSPLTRSLLLIIVLLGLGIGARYGWKRKIFIRKQIAKDNSTV
ncbi:hypothetical protein CFPU101_21210 [Chroococcus sp. FPU101]|nr:hypothetical protein CFPU101_21210 [Chroococcus sp. FPU101]